MNAPPSRSSLRPEIQALRAVAVVAVLLFHLWPNRLTGGYVGVDVFFAISGFLITAQLLREAEATGRISLAGFWARRARRLLPASLLVLALTAVATYLWVPANLWEQYFDEIRASTLYVQNWQLAGDAVDYLASDNSPSAVQHFWTLSAEEQFYAVWPLVIGAGLLIGRRRTVRFTKRAVLGVLALIVAASLAYSVYETGQNPAAAYFVTTTRIWEFGLGAIVAFVWPEPTTAPARARAALTWAGLALIVVTALTYTANSPFPGYLAAFPVIGALMVIVAGPVDHPAAPTRVAALRPVQLVGDISYSLYLWHYPLIVITPFVLGSRSGLFTRLVLLVLAFAVAWASKVYVEDPVRFSPRLLGRRRPVVVFACSAAAMAVLVGVATNGQWHIEERQVAEKKVVEQVLDEQPKCLGAASMDPARGDCDNPGLQGDLVPDPTVVSEDRPDPAECWTSQGEVGLNPCTFGPHNRAKKRIAVVGDSHAGQYRQAFAAMAKKRHWQVDMIGKAGCFWTKSFQTGSAQFEHECSVWKRRLDKHLARIEPYDAIVVSYKSGSDVDPPEGEDEQRAVVDGLVEAWRTQTRRGTKIIAIKDTPEPRANVVQCVEQHKQSPNKNCSISKKHAFAAFDGQQRAVDRLGRASLLDLTDLFCGKHRCRPVIGHVMVYRDEGHVTDTYITTLAPYLRRALAALL